MLPVETASEQNQMFYFTDKTPKQLLQTCSKNEGKCVERIKRKIVWIGNVDKEI